MAYSVSGMRRKSLSVRLWRNSSNFLCKFSPKMV